MCSSPVAYISTRIPLGEQYSPFKMWNLDVLSNAYDQYVDHYWRQHLTTINSSECSTFFNSCKKYFLKSFLDNRPGQVSGIIISAFYVNINELTLCDLDTLGLDIPSLHLCKEGLSTVEGLTKLHKENKILWLRIPFVEHCCTKQCSDENVCAFVRGVFNTVLNMIILTNNKRFISPVPVLNLATEKHNEMIEKLSLEGERPNFIFLRSVHPKVVADCDWRISNSDRQSDIFNALREKYQAIDYFDQMFLIFKHIVKNFEFESGLGTLEVEKKDVESVRKRPLEMVKEEEQQQQQPREDSSIPSEIEQRVDVGPVNKILKLMEQPKILSQDHQLSQDQEPEERLETTKNSH